MNLGDQKIFAIAEQIEKDLQLDMNLRDIFSNNLNSYFNFSLKEIKSNPDVVEFNFEIEEGSAKVILENANNYYNLKINNEFDEELYYFMFINKTINRHIDINGRKLSARTVDALCDIEN
jgi:hypothetical protein